MRKFSNAPNLVHVRHWRDILGGDQCGATETVVEQAIDLRTQAPRAIPATSRLVPATAMA